MTENKIERESFIIDLHYDNIYNYNLKKSFSICQNDFLKIRDINFDEQIANIESHYLTFQKTIPKNKLFDEFVNNKNTKDKLISDHQAELLNKIGPVSTLEYLVQSASDFDKKQVNNMITMIKSMRKFIFRWRKIAGDGNCFFRAVIFSYIENLIFEKKILIIKNICLILSRKFRNDNQLIRKLPTKLQSEYNFSNNNELVVFNILNQICIILENSTKNNETECTFRAYELFYTCIIFFKEFDYMLIKYLRYELYEYIHNNQDKIYHIDYQVKLGNLLPVKYEKSDDEFDFQSFFETELLPLYKEAEMISIHMIPFILKVDLLVFTYDFNQSSEKMKEFSCFLQGKHKIIVLYKKGHYDLIYEKSYFEKYCKHLAQYSNLYETDRAVLSSKELSDLECNYSIDVKAQELIKLEEESEKSKIGNDDSMEKQYTIIDNLNDVNFNITDDEFRENLIKKEFDSGCYKNFIANDFKNDNINYIAKTYRLEEIRKNYIQNLSKCEESLIFKINEIHNYKCEKCLSNTYCYKHLNSCKACVNKEITEKLRFRFNHILMYSSNEMKTKMNFEKLEIFKTLQLKTTPIKINKCYIEFTQIQDFTGEKLEDYLKQFKSEKCVQCLTPHQDTYNSQSIILRKYVLPCDCCLYDEKCFLEYLDQIVKNYNVKFTQDFYCICLHKFTIQDLNEINDMIYKNNYLQTNQLYRKINFKNTLNTYMQECLKRKCCLCFEDSIYFELKMAMDGSFVNESKDAHFCCEECGKSLNNKKSNIYCMIHLKEHKSADVKSFKK